MQRSRSSSGAKWRNSRSRKVLSRSKRTWPRSSVKRLKQNLTSRRKSWRASRLFRTWCGSRSRSRVEQVAWIQLKFLAFRGHWPTIGLTTPASLAKLACRASSWITTTLMSRKIPCRSPRGAELWTSSCLLEDSSPIVATEPVLALYQPQPKRAVTEWVVIY